MFRALLERRIIPVVEIERAVDATPLAEALLAGGIDIIEVTLRTDCALEAIERMRKACPNMLIGAGTVLSLEQSRHARDAGAQFGVAPGSSPEIINSFLDAGLPFVPGAITPTELEAAASLDCALLKFFPAGVAGGPKFLRALTSPYRNLGVQYCATGGVSAENMLEYLSIPLVRSVGGSWLATPAQIAAGDWSGITRRADEAMNLLQHLDRV